MEGVFDESIAMLNYPSTIIFGQVKNSNQHGNGIEWKLGSYIWASLLSDPPFKEINGGSEMREMYIHKERGVCKIYIY